MSNVIDAFILLVVVMDPIASIAALLSVTRGNKKMIVPIAKKAVLVALLVFLIFAIGGSDVLRVLGVSLDSFRVAGGLILAILGIQMVLGLSIKGQENEISQSAVVIGTPLISGPAVIATTMILVKDIGILSTLAAGVAALAVVMASLLFSHSIARVTGKSGLRVLSTMMGIVTVAWGIQFMVAGMVALI